MTHEIDAFNTWEDNACNVALRLVQQHQRFHSHPTDNGVGGKMIGWLRDLTGKGVSKAAATHMLKDDLRESMTVLRVRIASIGHDRLGESRGAVLLFLAQLPQIGVKRVLGWNDLWNALRDERWDDAADVLLLTEWPQAMQDEESKVRAVALQRVIRSGKHLHRELAAVSGMHPA